ncbi:hypothetical protein FQA39_LY07142 [Lamprigera yunnana]|nr:hypothetical protein FQA39_LY07142 [Lamprigera yunnana]
MIGLKRVVSVLRNKSVIWDPKDKEYYQKHLKSDAWIEIGSAMDSTRDECKQKMVNILASWRMEKAKETKSMGTQLIITLVYESRWFAFKVLDFLKDRNTPNKGMITEPIKSQRNRDKFYSDEFIYIFDKLSADDETEFWRYEQRRQCKARVGVKDGAAVKTVNVHTHDTSTGIAEADRVNAAIKKTLFRDTRTDMSGNQQMLAKPQLGLPRSSSNSRSFEKTRVKTTKTNKPSTINSSILGRVTNSGQRYRIYESTPGNIENFLLFDSGQGPLQILIFGRLRNLEILQNCDDNYTFSA